MRKAKKAGASKSHSSAALSGVAEPVPGETPADEVRAVLSRHGLLLTQDKQLPNVVSLLTGERLTGSWWSHPKGRLIFAVLSKLSGDPNVLFTKLLFGKDTLIHRSLWPAFLVVASAGDAWQLRGLSAGGRSLLQQTRRSAEPILASGPAVKELAKRLLVHSSQVHTEAGRHEIALEPWDLWARKAGVVPLASVPEARQTFERACQLIGAPPSALPWSSG